jgi:hypothetical protein
VTEPRRATSRTSARTAAAELIAGRLFRTEER